MIICDRCAVGSLPMDPVLATTFQAYRRPDAPEHWKDNTTARCDRCAQDLREYAALPGIGVEITLDEPLA